MVDVPTLCSLLLLVPLTLSLPSHPVPPAPLSPPRLLAKQSRQLVVSPVDCFSGDGPIVSVKLLYKPKDDTSVWSSIVGMCLSSQVGPGGGVWGGQRSPSCSAGPPGPSVVMPRRTPVVGQVVGGGHGFDMCSWPTVDNSENITLMNLRPVTAYVVKVQLSRPGDGGEGSKGPEAVMVTECLGGPPSL